MQTASHNKNKMYVAASEAMQSLENDKTVSHPSHSPSPCGAEISVVGGGNGETMQSLENDETVSHPSHSLLENADTTGVYHISTATAAAVVILFF